MHKGQHRRLCVAIFDGIITANSEAIVPLQKIPDSDEFRSFATRSPPAMFNVVVCLTFFWVSPARGKIRDPLVLSTWVTVAAAVKAVLSTDRLLLLNFDHK